ncbi:MAG: hypothetical protein M1821_006811 [Bathelium mastoideum]|nr:MAG: hypothetical protein M1821_006811 [Bathelium mastoideum]
MVATSKESAGLDPREENKYLLQVTAGPSYEDAESHIVQVNGSDPCRIDNEFMTAFINVRIRDYHGLPPSSPTTCSYFAHPLHKHDRYSISFSLIPRRAIPGRDLVMGFDFDHPVRDRLPPGFKTAMRIVTTALDPGIYADPYADEPFLYGAALSSFFAFRVGGMWAGDEGGDAGGDGERDGLKRGGGEGGGDGAGVIEEGADRDGREIRERLGMPEKAGKRRKFFLKEEKLDEFTFEKGRTYQADFFNQYLDFSDFSLKVPGISISVAKYIDEKTHCLRYVLKNRRTGDLLFVVIFKLLFGRELQETLNAENQEDGQKERVENHEESEQVNPISLEKSESAEREKVETGDDVPSEPSRQKENYPSKAGKAADVNQHSSESDTYGSVISPVYDTAKIIATSITSAFAALGFGGDSGQEQTEEDEQPEEGRRTNDKIPNTDVENMSDAKVEEFLKARQSSV